VIGLDRLSLNQATIKRATLAEAASACVRHGIGGIGLWRDRIDEVGAETAARLLCDAGLRATSVCRGGFFTAADEAGRRAAIEDTRAALEQTVAVGAPTLILVCGGLPPGSRDLAGARAMVADALAELAPVAGELGVQLGIEALHPMFCADRCVVSSLGEALDLAAPFPPAQVGVVVDTYHLWWDAQLGRQIARAGAEGRIASFQVCDWVVPLPADMLLGRGHLGDGSIDVRAIAADVEAAGYDGMVEVEIFNQSVWDAPVDETVATVVARFTTSILAADVPPDSVGGRNTC
jgi:sugar phosphate isomerase/epimerase